MLTKDQIIDALVADAAASIGQPTRCAAIVCALGELAKGNPVDVRFPSVEYSVDPDGSRRRTAPLDRVVLEGAPSTSVVKQQRDVLEQVWSFWEMGQVDPSLAQHALDEIGDLLRTRELTPDEQRAREVSARARARRLTPSERAVLDACSEMLLVPEKGLVRAPNEHDVELVAEAEWARRQEHRVAGNG